MSVIAVAATLLASIGARAQEDGDLRLADPVGPSKGRLEIYHNNEWRGVCDDLWGRPDAKVACRQLEFTGARNGIRRNDGPSPASMWLDNVGCTGSEDRLADCTHRGWGVHDCGSGEYAAVHCNTSTDSPSIQFIPPSLTVLEGAPDGDYYYHVLLGSAPSGDVGVTVTGTSGTDLITATSTLTFTTSDWNTPQEITVTAAEDDDTTEDLATLTHTAAGGGYDETADLAVTVRDNDLAQVTGVMVTPGPRRLDVTWEQVDGADGYKVQWKSGTQEFDSTREAAVQGSGATSARIGSLAAGTAYEVQVLATAEGIPDGPASTAVSGSTPDDSPLTASLEGPAGHNAQLAFVVRVTFSEPIRTSYVTMRDSAFDVTGGSVDAAYRVNYSSALWELRVIPSGRGDVTVALRANRACGNGGVCTKDGRRLSARAELSIGRINSALPVQVSFNALSTVTRYVRERKGYWVGVGLNRKPGESVTIPLQVTLHGGASASDYTGVPSSLTFGAYQKSKGFTVEAVSDSLAESGEQIQIAFGDLPSGISSQSGQETATIEITDNDSRGASVMQSGPVLTSATASGSRVTLQFDRALDAGSTPAPGDFVVLAGNAHDAASVAVSRVEVAGRETHLTLSRALRIDETVTASYLGGGMHPLQDSARLGAGALADVPVRHAAARSGEPVEIAAKSAGAISPIAVPRRLDLSSQGLSELPALEDFADVEVLNLAGNDLVDISALDGLYNLRVLDLSGNRVADLSPLANLTGLRRLDLSGNRIEDIAPLAGLNDLDVLLLNDNDLTDLWPLSRLDALTHLELARTKIKDPGPLAGLASLGRLDLAGNGMTDISGLQALTGLVWLRLDGNPTPGAAGLGEMPSLRWLWRDNALMHADGLTSDGVRVFSGNGEGQMRDLDR